MKDGINLLYGDGKRRWCFPRLATIMGDYEEAWRYCGVIQGHCVICTIPTFRRSKEGELHVNVERNNHDARTGAESLRLRTEYKNNPSPGTLQQLNYKDYQPINLFTDDFPLPGCSIYDTLAPDLFHQISKNFHDQVFEKWYKAVIKMGSSESILNTELDTRFQYIPIFQDLR